MLKRSVLCFLTAAVLPMAANAADSDILIRGENVNVTAGEYQSLIAGMLDDSQQAALFGSEQKYREYLANFYLIRQLAAEANTKGLGKDAATLARLKFEQDRILANIYLDQLVAQAQKPDFEKLAHEYYLVSKERYLVPEEVHAEHILIASGEKRSAEEARKLAEKLHKQVVSGASFTELAKENSDDPGSASSGGDLGFFPRSKMVKPFADAAFALKAGEVSKPVETQFGYHIIRLVERKPEHYRSFEEAKPEIIQALEQKFRADIRGNKIKDVTSSEKIKTDTAAVEALFKSSQP